MNKSIELTITDYSKEVLEAKQEAVERFLHEAGLHLSGQAQLELENDPRRIDTGNLRNSISYEVDGMDVYVGTNVEYGIYVHEGTQKMAPNRFLRNAFDRNEEQVQRKLKEALAGE